MNTLLDYNQLYVGQNIYIVSFGKIINDTIGMLNVRKFGGTGECTKHQYITFSFEKRDDKWLLIPKKCDTITLDYKQALQLAIAYQNQNIGINKTEIQKLEGEILENEKLINRYNKELSKLT